MLDMGKITHENGEETNGVKSTCRKCERIINTKIEIQRKKITKKYNQKWTGHITRTLSVAPCHDSFAKRFRTIESLCILFDT